jgi:hypothetical protein
MNCWSKKISARFDHRMKGHCIILLVALASMLAFANSQTPPSDVKPSICDQDTGRWEPYHINCDFDCEEDGWEIKCKCDEDNEKCDVIKCKIDRDGAPDEDDINFTCTSNGDGINPTCNTDIVLPDLPACVAQKVTTVLGSWVVGFSN